MNKALLAILCFCGLYGFAQDCKINSVQLQSSGSFLVFYENSPAKGQLIMNEQTFPITGSPQIVQLDENEENQLVYFSENPFCMLASHELSTNDWNLRPDEIENITIENFRATRNGINHLLNWEINQLEDNMYFKILKSTDGFFYNEIHQIPVNNTNEKNYNYLDQEVHSTLNNYQIELWDGSNNKVISSERISLQKTFISEAQFWPIPANQSVNMFFDASSFSGNGQLQVFNLNGQRLLEQTIDVQEGYNEYQINIAELQQGSLILKVSYAETQITQKIIKAN